MGCGAVNKVVLQVRGDEVGVLGHTCVSQMEFRGTCLWRRGCRRSRDP